MQNAQFIMQNETILILSAKPQSFMRRVPCASVAVNARICCTVYNNVSTKIMKLHAVRRVPCAVRRVPCAVRRPSQKPLPCPPMIKIITIAVCLTILYRMTFPARKEIKRGQQKDAKVIDITHEEVE